MNKICSKLRKLAREIKEIFFYRGLYRRSFAQEGEDLILDRLFDSQKSGFYIDIGAHHPIRFSNTFLFYRRGWRGICIDPSHNAINLFNRVRPNDIALEMGVSDTNGELTYFMFDEPALNTFDVALANQRIATTDYKVIDKRQVLVKPLADILSGLLTDSVAIDFMTIDVEGLDLAVLRSNDWVRFRPRIVLVEALDDHAGDSIRIFMADMGYQTIARTFNTEFYSHIKSPSEGVL